jgi:hypothetical protein
MPDLLALFGKLRPVPKCRLNCLVEAYIFLSRELVVLQAIRKFLSKRLD